MHDKSHWLDEPRNVRQLWRGFLAVLVLTVLAEAVVVETFAAALLLAGLFFAAAILYSSVGHGGASGYLASMGLVGVAPAIMRPTALVMNIAVASISLYKFTRANGFRWRLFLPFGMNLDERHEGLDAARLLFQVLVPCFGGT